MSHNHCCEGEHHHHDSPEMGIKYSVYKHIDIENVECLNESINDSGKLVFKPWEERMDLTKYVESDDDPELLFRIPFTSNIKLKGIIVIGGENGHHPSKVKLFKNRENLTFETAANLKCDEEFDLQPDTSGYLEYSTQPVKFNSVEHLTMFFPTNFGEETTKIYYIGLHGEASPLHKHGVTICTYEARPMISDHKVDLDVASQVQ